MREQIMSTDWLFPGDVIRSVSVDTERESRGTGVVTNHDCPTNCGYLIMFSDGWANAQCADSVVRGTIVTKGP